MRDRRAFTPTVAWSLSVGLACFVILAASLPCPFLQLDSAQASKPCCPRSGGAPKCPLSSSIDTCPFYVTEAKLGITETRFQIDVPAASAPELAFKQSSFEPVHLSADRLVDRTGLHLRNRVLLI